MSDNGFLWGEHGATQKIRPYEASAEIPFLVRWPGRVEAGAEVGRPVANIDVAPTILSAAGSEPEHAYDGRSFLDGSHDRVLLEQWKRPDRSVPNWAATRAEDFLYVEYYAEDRLIPAYREYYDLVEDPWELHNLLGDLDPMNDPPDAAELSLQLHRDVVCAGTSGPSACP
jgi:arylsulfatase A-like enzyme